MFPPPLMPFVFPELYRILELSKQGNIHHGTCLFEADLKGLIRLSQDSIKFP